MTTISFKIHAFAQNMQQRVLLHGHKIKKHHDRCDYDMEIYQRFKQVASNEMKVHIAFSLKGNRK